MDEILNYTIQDLENIYKEEYINYIKNLHINFFIKKNLHETVQHLNEILDISKEKNLNYVIFCTKHFSFEYLKLKNEISKIYFPDAIIFNNEKEEIEYTVQYKTIFRKTIYLNDSRFKLFNEKYDSYFTDKIKINFLHKQVYYNQFIDYKKYPRFTKTNISIDYILKNQNVINNFLKETCNYQRINEMKAYKIMLSKFLKYKK
jgi:hypothetical protein